MESESREARVFPCPPDQDDREISKSVDDSRRWRFARQTLCTVAKDSPKSEYLTFSRVRLRLERWGGLDEPEWPSTAGKSPRMPPTIGIEYPTLKEASGSMVSTGDGGLGRSLGRAWEVWLVPPLFTWVAGEACKELNFQQEPSYLRAESMHDTEGEIAEKLRGGSGDVRWLWLRDRFEFPLT